MNCPNKENLPPPIVGRAPTFGKKAAKKPTEFQQRHQKTVASSLRLPADFDDDDDEDDHHYDQNGGQYDENADYPAADDDYYGQPDNFDDEEDNLAMSGRGKQQRGKKQQPPAEPRRTRKMAKEHPTESEEEEQEQERIAEMEKENEEMKRKLAEIARQEEMSKRMKTSQVVFAHDFGGQMGNVKMQADEVLIKQAINDVGFSTIKFLNNDKQIFQFSKKIFKLLHSKKDREKHQEGFMEQWIDHWKEKIAKAMSDRRSGGAQKVSLQLSIIIVQNGNLFLQNSIAFVVLGQS